MKRRGRAERTEVEKREGEQRDRGGEERGRTERQRWRRERENRETEKEDESYPPSALLSELECSISVGFHGNRASPHRHRVPM